MNPVAVGVSPVLLMVGILTIFGFMLSTLTAAIIRSRIRHMEQLSYWELVGAGMLGDACGIGLFLALAYLGADIENVLFQDFMLNGMALVSITIIGGEAVGWRVVRWWGARRRAVAKG